MTNDDREFIHIVFNQEPDLHDQLYNEYLRLKSMIDTIGTWIECYHDEEVYENEQEKIDLLATFTKVIHIMEDEIQ